MKLTIASPKGIVCDCEVDSIVVMGDEGGIGILKDHVPVVIPVTKGYIQKTVGDVKTFYSVASAIVEFNNNVANAITQEYAEGSTLEEANQNLEAKRSKVKEENRKRLIDFVELEKELARNIKEIKASQI